MSKLTQEDTQQIKDLYESGMTYVDIYKVTGRCTATLTKILKGTRSLSQAAQLAHDNGRYKLSDKGRVKLSENGRKLCAKSGKCWTAPERKFKQILNELGIGVKFPDYVKEIFNLKDDEFPEVYFQYPLQRYVCDFVDVERKIVYSVNGDFWHSNPLLYETESLTKIQKHNLTQDNNRRIFLEKQGYVVCVIWESEINWNQEVVKEKIRATRKTVNPSGLHPENTAFDSQVAHSDWSDRLKSLWFKPKKEKSSKITKICEGCGKEFQIVQSKVCKRKHCSTKCSSLAKRVVDRPSYEDLLKDLSHMTKVAVGKKYGVSDKAVTKWIRRYEKGKQ